MKGELEEWNKGARKEGGRRRGGGEGERERERGEGKRRTCDLRDAVLRSRVPWLDWADCASGEG